MQCGWGTQLKVPEGSGIHGIVLISQKSAYGVWVAGNEGSKEVNVFALKEHSVDKLSFTWSNSTKELTCKAITGANSTITYIGR